MIDSKTSLVDLTVAQFQELLTEAFLATDGDTVEEGNNIDDDLIYLGTFDINGGVYKITIDLQSSTIDIEDDLGNLDFQVIPEDSIDKLNDTIFYYN
jgi:hypothetical protein